MQSTATEKPEKELFGAGILNVDQALSKAFWSHLMLRCAGLLLMSWIVRRAIRKARGTFTKRGGAFAFGTLLTSVGLMPLAPLLGLESLAGPARFGVELLARPLSEWDMLASVSLHRWLVLGTALPAVLGALLFFGSKRLRPFSGGLALGTAALAAQLAYSADVQFALGSFALRLVMLATLATSLYLARMQLDEGAARS
jgi:hypothetical protein